MWFSQAQFFQLKTPNQYDAAKLAEQLQPLMFTPCLPTMPSSYGWTPPLESETGLVAIVNANMILCFQFEEKILPAVVIRQQLDQKVKALEIEQNRKISQKEKYTLKEEITHTLLPRAFSKLSQVYAYIDTKNNWLVLDTISIPKAEKFMQFFKRSFLEMEVQPLNTSKLAPILTRWLLNNDYPKTFSIEKSCLLKDPNKQTRMIRCQQQDLSAKAIQLILKDGCEVNQLALGWQDRVYFTLAEDFSMRSIKFHDEIIAQAKDMEAETKQQQFAANFFIMAATMRELLNDLNQHMQDKPNS